MCRLNHAKRTSRHTAMRFSTSSSRLFGAASSLLGLIVSNAALTQAAKFADSFQGPDFTLNAIYDDSLKSTDFTLFSSKTGSDFGWHGIGTGQQMAGATMVSTSTEDHPCTAN